MELIIHKQSSYMKFYACFIQFNQIIIRVFKSNKLFLIDDL